MVVASLSHHLLLLLLGLPVGNSLAYCRVNGRVGWALPAHLLMLCFRCLVSGRFFVVEVFGSKQIGHCASCGCSQ